MALIMGIGEALSMLESGGNAGMRLTVERCAAQRDHGMAGPIVVVCSGPGVDIGERGRTRGVSVLGWMDAVAMNLAS